MASYCKHELTLGLRLMSKEQRPAFDRATPERAAFSPAAGVWGLVAGWGESCLEEVPPS